MPLIPYMVLKGGVAYLKFKSARKKGVKVFRKQIRQSGMSDEQIDELTRQYEDIGRLRSYLGDFDLFGGLFKS